MFAQLQHGSKVLLLITCKTSDHLCWPAAEIFMTFLSCRISETRVQNVLLCQKSVKLIRYHDDCSKDQSEIKCKLIFLLPWIHSHHEEENVHLSHRPWTQRCGWACPLSVQLESPTGWSLRLDCRNQEAVSEQAELIVCSPQQVRKAAAPVVCAGN